MYYFKAYYTDGTMKPIKSKKAFRNSKQVAENCRLVALSNVFEYVVLKIFNKSVDK